MPWDVKVYLGTTLLRNIMAMRQARALERSLGCTGKQSSIYGYAKMEGIEW